MKLKRSFLIVLLFLLVSVFMATYMQEDTGYVRVSIGNYLIETSLWFAGIAMFAIFVGTSIFFNVVGQLLTSTKWFNNWITERGIHSARKQTTKGLIAYAEGDWTKAQKFLTSSAEKAETPLINYLAAAQAASEQGNERDSEKLLKKAYESTAGADMAVGITQAQLQFANNHFEESLATLVRLQKKSPNHPFLLKLLKSVYLKLEDWNKLISLLPGLKKAKLASPTELEELERECWKNLLDNALEDIKRAQGSSFNTEPLDTLWDKLPATMRKDENIIQTYASHLIALDQSKRAEALIRKVLRSQWSGLLVGLYGSLDLENPSEALIHAESWLKSKPNDDELLLTLGRLSLRDNQWAKAREYFEASLKLKKSTETLGELCRLYAYMGESQLSKRLFAEGLSEQIGLPELPLPSEG